MENIQKAIEQVKKELERAEQKRREPGNNDAARIDRDIVCLNLRLQRLEDAAGAQEGTEPPADVPAYGKHFIKRGRKDIRGISAPDIFSALSYD